ncbi:MAG: hypothetical protein RIK87_00395 [Fuerstiella sp.]
MRHNIRLLLLAAATLIPASSFGAGIQQVAGNCCNDNCCPDNCCADVGCCQTNACCDGSCQTCPPGFYCDPCQPGGYGYCPACYGGQSTARANWNAWGMNWCGPHGTMGAAARMGVPGARAICHCCNTKAFPDTGWAPPARMPVNRTGQGFSHWNGNSGPFTGGAPMVYQPTDTAQLGYSYANVPAWRRNPGMVPPVPHPSSYHLRACPRGARIGACGPASCNACMMTGPVMYGGPVSGSMCPTCHPGYTVNMQNFQPAQVARAKSPEASVQPRAAVRQPRVTVAAGNALQPTPQVQTVSSRKSNPAVAATADSATPATNQSHATATKQSSSSAPSTVQHTSQQMRRPASASSRSTSSRSSAGRATRQKSGGWFGLPSLSEMKLF